MKTLLIFIDGLGWGSTDPERNPQQTYGGQFFRLPDYHDEFINMPADGLSRPIDAVLGVPGVPQSASGQTTMLCGISGQGALGQHLSGFPNEILRHILREHSIFKQVVDRGRKACFLNAFRPRFWELSEERKWTLSATTVATLAAGLDFFDLDDVNAGRSVYQEFTNTELLERGFDVQPMTPAEAGRIIGTQAPLYDFSLYEYFQSDKAGHSADRERIEHHLQMLDEFLTHVLESKPADLRVVLTSDHGNLEDLRTVRHTTNPVPLMVWGDDDFLNGVTRLDQVTPRILETLQSPAP